jgi:hypothetical protein
VEVGEVSLDEDWTCVSFAKSFANPIVVPGPMSDNDDAPAVIRVDLNPQDLEGCSFGPYGGFEMRIQRWEYQEGVHGFETVDYVVMERGSHLLPDGTMVKAGRLQTNNTGTFGSWSFASDPYDDGVSFAQDETPVVITAVTSVNGSNAVTTRESNITPTGFQVMMQEQMANPQGHTFEDIDYIAWEVPSSAPVALGTVGNLYYEVGPTLNAVTDQPYTLVYQSPADTFDVLPYFLAGMQTTKGSDTADLRWSDRDIDHVLLWVDEEQSQTTRVRHTGEAVGYVLLLPLK